jgi:hypothetical protein
VLTPSVYVHVTTVVPTAVIGKAISGVPTIPPTQSFDAVGAVGVETQSSVMSCRETRSAAKDPTLGLHKLIIVTEP